MKIQLKLFLGGLCMLAAGTTSADNNAPRLVKIEGQSLDQGKETYDYFYDDNRLDSIIHDQIGYQFTTKQVMAYDEANRLTSIEEFQWYKSKNMWTKANLFNYHYNKDGKLKTIEKQVISGDEYEYYEDYSYEYDSEGRLSLVEIYDYNTDATLKETIYTYDEQGRIKTVTVKRNMSMNGLQDYTIDDYVYNAQGQLVQKNISLNHEGTMTPDKVLNYTYDNDGGCIKVETYAVGIDNHPILVTNYVNNNSVELDDVNTGTTPLSYFPDFEACKFVRLSEETLQADINGNLSTFSSYNYTYADLPEHTGVEKVGGNEVSYRIDGNTLIVNSENASRVKVYNLAGVEFSTKGTGNLCSVTLPTGVYVLQTADKVYKIYIP